MDSLIACLVPFFKLKSEFEFEEGSFEFKVCEFINDFLEDRNVPRKDLVVKRNEIWDWAYLQGFPRKRGQYAEIPEWLTFILQHPSRSTEVFVQATSLSRQCREHGQQCDAFSEQSFFTLDGAVLQRVDCDEQRALDLVRARSHNSSITCYSLDATNTPCGLSCEWNDVFVINPRILVLAAPNFSWPKSKKSFKNNIKFGGGEYELMSVLYGHGQHFTACFLRHDKWFNYDDMKNGGKLRSCAGPAIRNAWFLFYRQVQLKIAFDYALAAVDQADLEHLAQNNHLECSEGTR